MCYNNFGGGFYKLLTGYTWLRSGSASFAYGSQYLAASGAYLGTYDARRFSVRPALYKKKVLFYNTLGDGFLNLLRATLGCVQAVMTMRTNIVT